MKRIQPPRHSMEKRIYSGLAGVGAAIFACDSYKSLAKIGDAVEQATAEHMAEHPEIVRQASDLMQEAVRANTLDQITGIGSACAAGLLAVSSLFIGSRHHIYDSIEERKPRIAFAGVGAGLMAFMAAQELIQYQSAQEAANVVSHGDLVSGVLMGAGAAIALAAGAYYALKR